MHPPSLQNPTWYHALTLTERLASLRGGAPRRPNEERNAELAQRRLQRWRSQAPFPMESCFAQRLALDGMNEEDLFHLLGEAIEAVANRFPEPPAWLTNLGLALSRPIASHPILVSDRLRQREAVEFLEAIEPFISQGQQRLREGVEALTQARPELPFDPSTVEDILLANLPGRLLPMLSRTLVLELNVARLQGVLTGDTPQERFQSFLERVSQRDHALALFQEYPVLARQLLLQIDHWVTFSLEFLQHLCADWDAIRTTLSAARDPGVLTEVAGGAGDSHQGGRAVLIARFSSGFQVVYKPRSLAVEVHFQELLTWLNERGDHPPFRTLKVLDRGPYGWVEFVAAQSCASQEEVRRFYERQGAYLALLYALEATDVHFQNLIAAGEHPVLIDLETLFHPREKEPDTVEGDRLANHAMAYSVLRVGLLPLRLWSNAESGRIDLSVLGAVPGQRTPQAVPSWVGTGTDEMRLARKQQALPGGQHRPSLGGSEVNAPDYAEAIVAGFTAVYRLLLKYRDDLLSADGPLARFAEDEVRVILRHTATYARLLQESFHPDLLRNALDRDRFFDWLWIEVRKRPELAQVIGAERDDLYQGDIPRFTMQPCSRNLWSSRHERMVDFFDEPGMTLVHRRLRLLSDEDLAQQLWFIRASLTTLSGRAAPLPRATSRGSGPQTRPDHERLLDAARAVGDRLEALALRGGRDVTWLDLVFRNEREWFPAPLWIDLYDGLPGVALFLAHLGAVTREQRYTALAEVALTTLRRRVEEGASVLQAVGGFNGWGGVIYTYAHLGALWEQPMLWREAEAVVELLPPLLERDEHLDIIGGAAGCLGGLLSLHQCSPSARTLAAARQCGARLLARAQPMRQGIGWVTDLGGTRPLTGFAHGAAGIAWALGELAALTGEERFRRAACDAVAYERSLFSSEVGNWPDLRERETSTPLNKPASRFETAWCHGAPGIGLARLRSLQHQEDAVTRAEIDAALRTTVASGFGSNHSLCHGDLGNLELLLQASETLDEPQWRVGVDRLAAVILDSIHGDGWRCGNPLKVETPGLMTGLAGIGYGLLRLAEPARVPSVLALAPPRRGG